ncbi:hypothetical protein SULI_08185 [Saccharolobus solfataricus]|uniref:Uncharacterized protein n=3 Tax=Saccharolobus solfataricus TaxID=2287 RepID=Q7LXW1_SACS2|nr:hypothetical protein [Saccharolobus solfataricus]AAK40856.1 Hypothetical protein SSO0537 [Saccharolobus solfataricus P2]AKA73886.1 hypothetical protein SULB_1633 [Saccharolobus solfataricus]AKA76584.1 hypothetical protein SULC_1631 [Saccharolobus solfataricus]AKA79277.1 hypothetical protein SULA_1632 [Saccharolobus solfataricus]AZF68363.1 hypothetical protein SULG_08185 [Saccharolobus solfataricus]
MAKSIGIGSILIIISIIIIGSVATIFYLENVDVNISVNPIYWRIYSNNYEVIAFAITATNNAPLTQTLNITLLSRYLVPGSNGVLKIIANSTTITLKSHSSSTAIVYLTFSSSTLFPEIEEFKVLVHGLYGYSKQFGDVNTIYTTGLTRNIALLMGINQNQLPTFSLVGSFTPSANFNYSYSIVYYQYNYTSNTSFLFTKFTISPLANQYLQPGKYNVTLSYLDHANSFLINIPRNTPVYFYLFVPMANFNMTVILQGQGVKYQGYFTVSIIS